MKTSFESALISVCGARRVLREDDLKGRDCGVHPNNFGARLSVRPDTAAMVSNIVTLCNKHRVPIVPHGGLTGLSGGASSAPDQLILDTTKLKQKITVDPINRLAHVSAGNTLHELILVAMEHNLCPGIDIGARGTATLGGMISTNAGGSEAFRTGVMRNRVLGLEFISGTGCLVSDLKTVLKANEGIDVKQLLIGAEGTLGVITGAVLRLDPVTNEVCTFIASFPSLETAINTFFEIRKMSSGNVIRAEIMWRDYAVETAKELGLSSVLPNLDSPVHVIY